MILPYLLSLAQQGYPQPKDFKTYDQMLPQYTFALGGTEKIKQFVEWVNSQEQVMTDIKRKYDNKEAYAME